MDSISNSNPWPPNAVFKDCSQEICSIYCPQWCYIIYSPPPPSIILGNDTDDDSSGFQFSPLIVAVIGILASTFILVTYYTIISRFCRHRGGRTNDPTSQIDHEDGDAMNNELAQVSSSSGLDEALIKSITVFKYKKGGGLVEGSDCSVCLSEFQENESLRLLPKCHHAFHLPCIDTWLKSHSSCPLCRSNISSNITTSCPNQRDTPVLMEAPSSMNMNALEYQQRSDVVIVIQSSEPSSQQEVVVSFGDEVLPKWPMEGVDDGENMEQLDGHLRSVSIRDILNDSEDDVELQREGSDTGSSRGTEGEQSEGNGKSGVVDMVKRSASTGRSMFTRYMGKFAKLKPRADGPFKVLKRIGENVYKIELPKHLDISDTLNMADLAPYYGDDSTSDPRMSLFQSGEHDTGVSSNDLLDVGLFEVGLTIPMNKVLEVIYY